MAIVPKFVLITVSDSCYNKKSEDKNGPYLKAIVEEMCLNANIEYVLLPDEKDMIKTKLLQHSTGENAANIIITNGGTGLAPRDVTPEATREVIERECPQLAIMMTLKGLEKTPFAALSRAVCGIRNRTLIINMPGSYSAVSDCILALKPIIPHAIKVLSDDLKPVKSLHDEMQKGIPHGGHNNCPSKTGSEKRDDRNSPFPMFSAKEALNLILESVKPQTTNISFIKDFKSPLDLPPFRASIKDGYAMKSIGLSGVKKVVGFIAAGDNLLNSTLEADECFKINTGAPVPLAADCVVQVEDTKLCKCKTDGTEELVEILVEPKSLLDIRPIGCDLKKGENLFPSLDLSQVVVKSLLSSVGCVKNLERPTVAVISTGNELMDPESDECSFPYKIFDSNTTMLVELLKYFGFDCVKKVVVSDSLESVEKTISDAFLVADFVICTGGVSMGDKDYIKPALNSLGYEIIFGRVNMKPGKPMTFAHKENKSFFGLPGNPVSAFVTFHLFVLPALRRASGWQPEKCSLAKINVKLENKQLNLDPRPEFVRASVISKHDGLYARITGDQISSRLQSIVGADVLLHLPGRSETKCNVYSGETLQASVLRYDFISKYE